MTVRRVIRRKQARDDIEEAAKYYAVEAGVEWALRYTSAVEEAIRHIAAFPSSGSQRYAQLLRADGLRFWPVKRFPYLVFYLESGGTVDVWRVLHAERDIPAWLRDQG